MDVYNIKLKNICDKGIIKVKIAITTVQMPFVYGGAEILTKNLKAALVEAGNEVEIITMPFIDNPLHMIENHIAASRLMDINYSWAGKIDLCIGLKFPAYYIPHTNKINWILHQHRAAYELFDTELSNIKNSAEGNQMRKVIFNADNQYLSEAKRIYTISNRVSKRMAQYNGISSVPLYHPCPDMSKFYCAEYENYILMPSRIGVTKRQMLALEAMCQTKSNVKLYIVGRADNVAEKEKLLTYIREKKLQDRVKYFDYVTQEEKINLYANAKAVLFIPVEEDYGYITLEAMAASKAVITALDSGGPLEFVTDEENGEVVEPTPIEIARAMDYVITSKYAAVEMGECGKKRLKEMNITWENVVKELTK